MESDERNRKKDAWRLEPERKTEMPETGVVSHGVEGIDVDPNCEGHHERGQVKSSRSQSEAPGQEAKDADQEEAEEISFVPSAISVPRKPLFRCDN